jgi:streptogramin lyase
VITHLKHHLTIPASLFIALALTLSFLTPLTANAAPEPADVPAFAETWGSNGTGDGQFGTPAAVDVDEFGNLYVADSEQNRIQKFNSSGVYQAQWDGSSSGNGIFNLPAGITFTPDGSIYVLETYGSRRVMKFDSNWNYLSQWGGTGSGDGKFNSPSCITSDSLGNVYILDAGNRRVQKFDSNGTYVTKWGSNGSGNGQFLIPQGIAIDGDDNIYVADTYNNRIQKFDSDGVYLTQWGTAGSGNGQLNQPFGIEVDLQGNVNVADIGNSRIQKFDANGAYLAQWGSEVSNFAPYYITADAAGNLYASDGNNLLIQKFTYPPETASLTSSVSGTDIELESTAFTTFSCSTSVTEDSLSTSDTSQDYPLGLVDFCLDVVPGSTNTVSITFETDLSASEATARKYNPTTQTYTDIQDALITETTLNSNPALILTYDITDGGDLDDDNTANGTILDPVGLAIAAETTTTNTSDTDTEALAETGENMVALQVGAALIIVIAVASWVERRKTPVFR